MTTLLLSARATEDNQALWRAAVRRGWIVERLRGLTIPDGITDEELVLHVEALFAPEIAKKLSLKLVEPREDWLVELPFEYRQRNVQLTTLGDARMLKEPAFVKPPNDKSFTAKVFASGGDLPGDYDDSMTVLVAEPVEFEVEYRCFVLDREARTMSPYLRYGRLARLDDFSALDEESHAAADLLRRLLADRLVEVPRAVVIDVGTIAGRGWAIVEANGAWGSGIYGCDPDEVLEVIRHAVEKATP